jgi:hypothetical protein
MQSGSKFELARRACKYNSHFRFPRAATLLIAVASNCATRNCQPSAGSAVQHAGLFNLCAFQRPLAPPVDSAYADRRQSTLPIYEITNRHRQLTTDEARGMPGCTARLLRALAAVKADWKRRSRNSVCEPVLPAVWRVPQFRLLITDAARRAHLPCVNVCLIYAFAHSDTVLHCSAQLYTHAQICKKLVTAANLHNDPSCCDLLLH